MSAQSNPHDPVTASDLVARASEAAAAGADAWFVKSTAAHLIVEAAGSKPEENCSLLCSRDLKEQWSREIASFVRDQLTSPESSGTALDIRVLLKRYNFGTRRGLVKFTASEKNLKEVDMFIENGVSFVVVNASGLKAKLSLFPVLARPVVAVLQHFLAPHILKPLLFKVLADAVRSVHIRPSLDEFGRYVVEFDVIPGRRVPNPIKLPDLEVALHLAGDSGLSGVKSRLGFLPPAVGQHKLVFIPQPATFDGVAQLFESEPIKIPDGLLKEFTEEECASPTKRARA